MLECTSPLGNRQAAQANLATHILNMETDVPCSEIFLMGGEKIYNLLIVGRDYTGPVLCTTNPTQSQKRELSREGPRNLPLFSTRDNPHQPEQDTLAMALLLRTRYIHCKVLFVLHLGVKS